MEEQRWSLRIGSQPFKMQIVEVVLSDGAVVEEGTHQQLIKPQGLYCRLVERISA